MCGPEAQSGLAATPLTVFDAAVTRVSELEASAPPHLSTPGGRVGWHSRRAPRCLCCTHSKGEAGLLAAWGELGYPSCMWWQKGELPTQGAQQVSQDACVTHRVDRDRYSCLACSKGGSRAACAAHSSKGERCLLRAAGQEWGEAACEAEGAGLPT